MNSQQLNAVLPGTLYGRQWRVLVQTEDQVALDVSDLRCTFVVERTATIARATCHLMIYNLSPETEARLIKEGFYLILESGYAEQYGKIFEGDIIQVFRNREDGINYRLEILAIDGNAMLDLNFVKTTLAAGCTPRDVVESVARISNKPFEVDNISENLEEIKLPRPKVIFGDPKSYMDDISKGNQSFYWVENGKLILRKYSDPIPDEQCIVLTPNSGLIGTPEYTDLGIRISMLLNPRIALHGMVKIDNELISRKAVNISNSNGNSSVQSQQSRFDEDGEYQIYSLRHSGDTHGDNWVTEIVGIGRNGRVGLPLMVENSEQSVRG